MTDQKSNLARMSALLEDLKTAEDFLRTAEQTTTDGHDVWVGLGRLGDLDAGKELVLKPLVPRHKITRQAIVKALETYMPKIREDVLTAIRQEFNQRKTELEDL